jgi:hypothetical protein
MGDHGTARNPRRRSERAIIHAMESRAPRGPAANGGAAARTAAAPCAAANDGRLRSLPDRPISAPICHVLRQAGALRPNERRGAPARSCADCRSIATTATLPSDRGELSSQISVRPPAITKRFDGRVVYRFRQYATATPASPSFRIATICDSVNRDFFIGLPSGPKSCQKSPAIAVYREGKLMPPSRVQSHASPMLARCNAKGLTSL